MLGLAPSAAALLLLGLVIAFSLALLLVEGRQRRMEGRLAEAARAARGQPQQARPTRSIQLAQRQGRGRLAWLTRLIALDLARPQEHPAPWPVVILAAMAGGAASSVFFGVLVGPAAATPLGIATALLIARATFSRGTSNYREKLFVQMPDAMGMIVRALKAGIPVNEAIRTIARESPEPTRREFAQVAAEQAIGVALEASLLTLHERTGLREYGYFAVTIALQQQTGGSLTETLDNLADVVRKRVQIAARGRALAGQARMSAVILTAIPFVALGALSVLNPRYIAFYFTHEKGPFIAALALALLGAGVIVMQLMIRRSLSLR
jgi:tight adherence protein B